MNNQQQIKQIESKIKNIQTFIDTWKLEIINYEKTLLALAQQLTQIKNKTIKKPTWK